MSDDGFEPRIVAFLCNWCTYTGADLAGTSRLQYPPNVKLVRLPCSGKTDVGYILIAFEEGADGVYVVGCPIGNCHHVRGNERGKARVERAKQLLDDIGLSGERLDIFFLSGGMGATFAQYAEEMTERIRALGPNPLRERSTEEPV